VLKREKIASVTQHSGRVYLERGPSGKRAFSPARAESSLAPLLRIGPPEAEDGDPGPGDSSLAARPRPWRAPRSLGAQESAGFCRGPAAGSARSLARGEATKRRRRAEGRENPRPRRGGTFCRARPELRRAAARCRGEAAERAASLARTETASLWLLEPAFGRLEAAAAGHARLPARGGRPRLDLCENPGLEPGGV